MSTRKTKKHSTPKAKTTAAAKAATTADDAAAGTPPGGKRGTKAKPATGEPAAATDKPAKAPKPGKVKKVSGLDAAAMVLAESGSPMKAVDMLAAITKRGLWTSKGKTPEATMYAAIIREIAAKGSASRFRKHDRGLFVAGAATSTKEGA